MKKKNKVAGITIASVALALAFLVAPQSAYAKEIEPTNLPPLGQKSNVSFDHYSLKIDGVRTPIYSGEFHYWRLPSQSLWWDVLQKMKAEGFNAVTIYFDWSYHSPKQGVYDFSGVRDIDKLLDMAQKAGLYVIARPGPYINGETDAGGFPSWLLTQKGRARTAASDYMDSCYEWLGKIDPILKKHQITNGGNVILYQVENEYTGNDSQYMENLEKKIKQDGINVPTFHNDKSGPNGRWAQGKGATDMYAFDRYAALGNVGALPNTFEDPHTKGWGNHSPIFMGELGNGWFDPWGGDGYEYWREKRGTNAENIINKHVIGEGGSIISAYMTYGGTSWGYLPFPGGYTSYDYGSAINEKRQLDDKTAQQKKIGLMLQNVKPIAKTDNLTEGATKDGTHYIIERENPDTKTKFYFVRHNKTNTTLDSTYNLSVKTDEVDKRVPVRVNGQTSKIVTANYDFGKQHLVYSSNEIFTQFSNRNEDTAVVYSDKGDPNETVFKYGEEPDVKVLSGKVDTKWNEQEHTLSLSNKFNGLANVQINIGNKKLRLILGTYEQMDNLWQQETTAGTVLVNGPYLVRKSIVNGDSIALQGDTHDKTSLSVYAPEGIKNVTWNGNKVNTKDSNGWLDSDINGVDNSQVKLPELKNWKYQNASPESSLNFDDSTWQTANKTSSNSTTKSKSDKILFADDYGFHHGNTWYRGHFKANGNESSIKLDAITGNYGAYSVWLNGKFVDSVEMNTAENKAHSFNIDKKLLNKNKDNVVSVLVANMGHEEDGNNKDNQKRARGLIEAGVKRSGENDAVVSWKLQGNKGGENIVDSQRGSYNVGGLYGDRVGWYLPGYDDSSWKQTTLPDTRSAAGVGWYKTSFDLNFPKNYDVPISLKIDDNTFGKNGAKYRAYIYINGWMYGQYINNVGPQNEFYLPAGLLNGQGHNDISIAVWSLDGKSAKLGKVSLIANGSYNTPNTVSETAAPSFRQAFGNLPVTKSVKIDGSKVITMKQGETKQFNAAAAPAESKNSDYRWSVQKNSVINVDENGEVTAQKPGMSYVTVKTSNGLTDKVLVRVTH